MRFLAKQDRLKGLLNLARLSLRVGRDYGVRTLIRKISFKLGNRQDAEAYARWIAGHEPGPGELEDQRHRQREFSYRPLISIVMPVYNPSLAALQAAVESVTSQTYDHWELCLADGASSRPEIRDWLQTLPAREPRLRAVFLDRNYGISGNSNQALKLARGEFAAFLDHDDLLAPWALFRIVESLNQDPRADLFYSDRDLLTHDGRKRIRPFFKPDWSPETLLSVNYLIHLCVIRKALIDDAGGFSPPLDGAQDWDLFFRITEQTQRIVHLPEVLYHWRENPGSAAWSIYAKPYALAAQLAAVTGHLRRRGLAAAVEFGTGGHIRVRWPDRPAGTVSVILLSGGRRRALAGCVRSILEKTAGGDFQVVLTDGHGLFRGGQPDPRVRFVECPGIIDPTRLANEGARAAAGDFLVFLNPAVAVMDPDWLGELLGWFHNPAIGVVGGKILGARGRLQRAGYVRINNHFTPLFSGLPEYYGCFGSSEWYRNLQAVSGGFMMVRREVFEQVGGFDLGEAAADPGPALCLKVTRAGYRVLLNPFARVQCSSVPAPDGLTSAEDGAPFHDQPLPGPGTEDPFFNRNLSVIRSLPVPRPEP